MTETNSNIPAWALRTPLYELHAERGGFAVGGWKMGTQVPAYYNSILAEHRLLREGVGLVDLGRRGLFRLSGVGALSVLEHLLTQKISSLKPGQWHRIPMVGADGLMVDFARVGRDSEDVWFLFLAHQVAHEALEMLKTQASGRICEVDDLTDAYAWVAVAGPQAKAFIAEWTRGGAVLEPGEFGEFLAASVACTLWRKTEDYYELFCQPELLIKAVTEGLVCSSAPQLCGWAAYENWRLEMGFLRYGFEIKEGVSPLDLGLDDLVDFNRDTLLAAPALGEQFRNGAKNMLIYFSLDAMRLPRKGQALYCGAKTVGRVASGGFGLALNRPIGTAWVMTDGVDFDLLEIEIHRQRYPVRIRKPPLV